MDKFVIRPGNALSGKTRVSGAKNASLTLMAATILAPGRYKLYNTPVLLDITTMTRLLETMGTKLSLQNHTMTIDSTNITRYEAPHEYMKEMRASIYVLGPLLTRFGYAKVSLPGGCAWGPRPVNLHIEGMKKLGADIHCEDGYIIAKAKTLRGARVLLDISSVGATANIMMAGVLAEGTTTIENAAMEPEIISLAEFLVKMGARIDGIGTSTVEIEGVDSLHATDFTTIPDRIETGTFLIAGAIAGKKGGKVRVEQCNPHHIGAVSTKLEDAGATLTYGKDFVEIEPLDKIRPVNVTTAPYSGFPTDMQAQWIALMTLANGTSTIRDTIYFTRFTHVPELKRLGAKITVKGNIATVIGTKHLKGAKVISTDLRASASLILAGLVAEGTTEVLRVHHVDRGYEHIEKKLRELGARIERVSGQEF